MSIYTEKNKNRKLGREQARNDGFRNSQIKSARAARRLRNGAFGNATAYMWNTMVVGTTGAEREDKGDDPKITVVVAS